MIVELVITVGRRCNLLGLDERVGSFMQKIDNMRVHFYGVQGSGSIFPSRAERDEARELSDIDLLEKVFHHIEAGSGVANPISKSVEDLLGGEINRKNIAQFRRQFELEERRVYGGWTSCFRIETSDGYDIVFDCGSGFRICAQDIVDKWEIYGNRDLTIFGTHAHYDHTEGFDQAAVCFDPRNNIRVIGNYQYLKALDQNLGIFSRHIDMDLKGIQTPLNYELMPSSFSSIEIRNLQQDPVPEIKDPTVGSYHDIGQPFVIGKTVIQPFEVFHPDPCLAYHIEHNGKVFVYCTDHELRRGDDPDHPLQVASREAEDRLRQYSQDADLLYRDGQFLRAEYEGELGIGTAFGVSRKDWGHSCFEDVIEMAESCDVKTTYIGHHDPNRSWAERNWMDETLVRKSKEMGRTIEMAKAETVIDL